MGKPQDAVSVDDRLMAQRLLGNALKYSRGAEPPSVDIGWDASRGTTIWFTVPDGGG